MAVCAAAKTFARTARAVPTQLNAAIRTIRCAAELPKNVAKTMSVMSFGSSTKNLNQAIENLPDPAAEAPQNPDPCPQNQRQNTAQDADQQRLPCAIDKLRKMS